jgi:hypothetical protein
VPAATSEGRIIKRGRTIGFGEATIRDTAGTLVTVGRATCMILAGRSYEGPAGLSNLAEDFPRFEVDRGSHTFDLFGLPVDPIANVQRDQALEPNHREHQRQEPVLRHREPPMGLR